MVMADEPRTYRQAIKHPEAEKWRQAMNDEYDSLVKRKVWTLVELPSGSKAIKSRWVFKVKLDNENKPDRYKARIVAKGFQQQYGIDYTETFAPVVKFKSIKMVLSLVSLFNLELKQLDFETAFLNAELTETVYMEQPDGFSNGKPHMVWKLLKALYGLKQSPHEWNQDLHNYLISIKYVPLKCDSCVYIKETTNDRIIILCLYVDDTIVAYHKHDESIWVKDKQSIASKYSITDFGDCNWILNMEIKRDRINGTITLSQEAYINRVLQQHNMVVCKVASNPELVADLFRPPTGSDLTPLTEDGISNYRSIIGSLSYAANTTRIDVAHVVNELSRFNTSATQFHLKAAKHVLRYLAGTTQLGLVFGNSNSSRAAPTIEIYTDANWGGDTETRRSTTGVVVKLNGDLICWQTKKQRTVARSSTEAEYMALSEATSEAMWIRIWVKEVSDINVAVQMYCDNQSAIALTKNDQFHQRTKHIDIRFHYVRERYAAGDIILKWVSTFDQQADLQV
jgi:hypothetical protein